MKFGDAGLSLRSIKEKFLSRSKNLLLPNSAILENKIKQIEEVKNDPAFKKKTHLKVSVHYFFKAKTPFLLYLVSLPYKFYQS